MITTLILTYYLMMVTSLECGDVIDLYQNSQCCGETPTTAISYQRLSNFCTNQLPESWLVSVQGTVDTYNITNGVVVFELNDIQKEIYFTDAPVRRSFQPTNSSNVTRYDRVSKYSLTAPGWVNKNAVINDEHNNAMVISLRHVSYCKHNDLHKLITLGIENVLNCYRIEATITNSFGDKLVPGHTYVFIDSFVGFFDNIGNDVVHGFDQFGSDVTQGFHDFDQTIVRGWDTLSDGIKSAFRKLGEDLTKDLTNVGDEIRSKLGDFERDLFRIFCDGPCTAVMTPLIKSLSSGGGEVDLTTCEGDAVEAAATCEGLGLGPEDPFADSCAAMIGTLFGASCETMIQSINTLTRSGESDQMIAKVTCKALR